MTQYHPSMEPDTPRDLEAEIDKLKQDSHPPVDIAPRIYDELDRWLLLGRLFYDVPTEDLKQAAEEGLTTYNYVVKGTRR